VEIRENEYLFTDDKKKINVKAVWNLLKNTEWAKNRPVEVVQKSIETSLCFAVFKGDIQVGFARAVSDYAVYSLILDVAIDEEHRGKGLGKKLVKFINNHPSIISTSKFLWTKSAEGLYSKFGYREEKGYTFMFKR
jgi:GNAT superfamily N-acetyltransferase